MNSTRLFRKHLQRIAVGTGLHVLVATVLLSTIMPFSATLLVLAWLPTLVLTLALDILVTQRLYAPLRVMDALPADKQYAQNNDLSRGVRRLHELPLLSVLRVFAVRGVLGSVVALVVFTLQVNAELAGGLIGAFLMLGMATVPLVPAVFELYTLPVAIKESYAATLAPGNPLSSSLPANILVVPSGVRLVLCVFMLAIVPVMGFMLASGTTAHPPGFLFAGVILLLSLPVGWYLVQDARQSTGLLLETMHQVERNRHVTAPNIITSDEFALLAHGMRGMVEGLKEQSFIRDTFGKHVPRAIVEAVIRNGVKLTGERRTVAILLVDIQQFGGRIDKETPAGIVSLLNRYLALVIGAAQHFGGTIDKIAGDRVLVVFGAPVTVDSPVDRALLVALEIRKSLMKLNHSLARDRLDPLRTGIFVHYGPVIAGHIGAAERWEYSVVGEAVHDVYGMKMNTRVDGVDIIVSPSARSMAGNAFRFSSIDAHRTVAAGAAGYVVLVEHGTEVPGPHDT